MSTTVVILGAGASRQAGAPLMLDFLDVAHNLWKLGRVQEAQQHFQNVFRGISALQRVHSKATLDIQNIESVFAAFEMARTLGQFADYSVDQIETLLHSMRIVILKTLENTI